MGVTEPFVTSGRRRHFVTPPDRDKGDLQVWGGVTTPHRLASARTRPWTAQILHQYLPMREFKTLQSPPYDARDIGAASRPARARQVCAVDPACEALPY